MTKALELSDIKKSFQHDGLTTEVIRGVSISVNKGELVALVGPSGSGKTTLLQIAGLLDVADSGVITIGSTDVSLTNDKIRTAFRRNNVGFVYQSHHLLPEFSALENVAMPLFVMGVKKSEALTKAEKILGEVDLSNHLHHRPSQLSGGQQQRVAIARAVVAKPSLILADEPTGNLDSELSQKIFHLLRSLVKDNQIGCLVVTHNLELAKMSDRIIEIRDGIIASVS